MPNQHLDDFMRQFPFTGLTFDDVSLETQYADFLPSETSLESRLTRNISLNIPFISAAMDTVTEADMAIAMALLGGIGIIHKNLDPVAQRTQVKRVKYYLNGFLAKARTMAPENTVDDINQAKAAKQFKFSSFPVVDQDKKLVGIVTSHQIKYCEKGATRLGDIMVRKPLTAPEGATIEQAYRILMDNKIAILPVVDGDGMFLGMYCFKDVRDILRNQNPMYNRDDRHQLRCGAAVGPNDQERVERLAEAQVDVVVVDTAHGHSRGVIEMVQWVKRHYPHIDVVAGNVATGDAVRDLIRAGVDGVKVGIGPGSICTTRVVAGVGVPQISAIYHCVQAAQDEVPIIADGGIRFSGDVAKALGAGADTVMMGGVLAGTDQSPGEKVIYQGRQYVVYRGMGSLEAMKSRAGSRERYGQHDVEQTEKLVPEGIEGTVVYRGGVQDVMTQFIGGLRSSLGYCGCRTVEQLRQRARFVRVTSAGRQESHPHDIRITKEAPNYQLD